jgi:trehalose-6-phosphatase
MTAAVEPLALDAVGTTLRSRTLNALAATPRLLVALDFDGVLAELVDDPLDSRPLPGAHRALARLAELDDTYTAYITGRDLAGLRRVADPHPAALLIGSHGAQTDLSGLGEPADAPTSGTGGTTASGAGGPKGSGELPQDREAGLLAQLDEVQDELVGMRLRAGLSADWRVEVKPLSRVFHTRGVDPAQTRWLHTGLSERLDGLPLRRVPGHDIVEYAVRHSTKGGGLDRVIAATGATGALYAGDDVTDEDAFAHLSRAVAGPDLPVRLGVSIKVGPGPSAAGHRLADPPAVAGFLGDLARLRAQRVR